MSKVFYAENLKDLEGIAKEIIAFTTPNKKFAFYGEMGVGKTTLIKALSLHLGVRDIVSSPTFSIVNEYETNTDDKIYHFDFYRIENEQEAYDMGYEEYFFSSDYCFIEWPEKVLSLINDEMITIKLSLDGIKRKIEVIL